MKKTLITLLALAGVAMADVVGDWAATFSTSDQTISQTYENYSATFVEGCPISVNFTGLTITGTTKSNGYATDSDAYNPSALRPNINVAKDTGNSYVLTFKITNNTSDLLIIEQIDFVSFLCNGSGKAHASGNAAATDIIYTLSTTGETPVTLASNTISQAAYTDISSPKTVELNIAATPIELTANSYTELSLTVSKGSKGNGSFVGLSSATFKVVPEPATATLSLLALVGLAARRRRK